MTIDTATLAAEAKSFAVVYTTDDDDVYGTRSAHRHLPAALELLAAVLRAPAARNPDVRLVAVSAMGNDATLCTFTRPLKPTEF